MMALNEEKLENTSDSDTQASGVPAVQLWLCHVSATMHYNILTRHALQPRITFGVPGMKSHGATVVGALMGHGLSRMDLFGIIFLFGDL